MHSFNNITHGEFMDPKQYFKQMLEFNKAAFDNASKTMSLFQNSYHYELVWQNQIMCGGVM